MTEIAILNGTVIDGTGAARFRADVLVSGDRITKVGDLSAATSARRIDASGRIVAPGFVDTHNHTDAWLLKTPHLQAKTSQGFTTEVIMADGISYAPVNSDTAPEWIFYMKSLNALSYSEYDGWQSLGEYMDRVDRANVQNAIAHIPYANVRSMACGFGRGVPDDFQMALIRREIERGMAEGAVGVSTGLDYISQCFATTDELVEACEVMAEQRGLYVTHMRYRKGITPALEEAVEIGRRAGVPVHISHLKAADQETIEQVLEYVDGTARHEVDFSFDVYPYLPGSTMLNFLLPYEIWEDGPLAVMARLNDPALRRQFAADLEPTRFPHTHIAWLQSAENACHIGSSIAEYIEALGKEPADALCDLLIEEGLAVLLVFHHGDDSLISPFLKHDLYMMGSDGIYFPDGQVHPRVYGSAPRLLGPCVRDQKLFSLEEAVHKLSGRPAERFGLARRGRIAEGCHADVVLFDADTVADRATYENPHQLPTGIDAVLVNGVPIISEGAAVDPLPGVLPGRALRYHS